MTALTARSPLIVDATDDLKRIDGVMTRIIRERSTWDEFFRDPNGVLIAAGLHPPTTPEINARANQIFYSVLSNKPLLDLVARTIKKHKPGKAKNARFAKVYEAGLQRGEIRHAFAQDVDALNSVVSDRSAFRKALQLTLHDLNRRGLLEQKHPKITIDKYIDQVVQVAGTGKSLRSVPALESWDANYGVGKSYGAAWIEIAAFVTGGIVVEVATGVTLAISGDVHRTPVDLEAMAAGAQRGEKRYIEALAMYGKMLAFGGELMMHVANFESAR